MSLHYSAGKLLLQNISDNEWYYLEARVDSQDGLVHLYPHQDVAGDYALADYDPYAVIRANNGDLYKVSLYTNAEEVVTYQLDNYTTIAYLPSRVFLKDTTTGLLYQLTLVENEVDGIVYPQLSAASAAANSRTFNSPFECPSPVTTIAEVCLSAANFFAKATVVIPNQVPLPNGGILLGAGGEGIQGAGNSEFMDGAS